MNRRPKNSAQMSDAALGKLLRDSKPEPSLSSGQLHALSNSIMAQIDALPPRSFAYMEVPAWMIDHPSWVRRGAMFAAMLLLVLGFTAGRNLNNADLTVDAGLNSYAYADETPFPNYMTLQNQGDSDEAAE